MDEHTNIEAAEIKPLFLRLEAADKMGVDPIISDDEAEKLANYVRQQVEEKNRLLLEVIKAAKDGPIQPQNRVVVDIAIHLLKEKLF
jgi:hypothetical protein